MRSPAFLSAVAVAVAANAALAAIACGDATAPRAFSGHYELVAVNGQPLPSLRPPSYGFFTPGITIGDLVLRDDGSCGLGLEGYLGGSWSQSGSLLTLKFTGTETSTGVVGGDSATIDLPAIPAPPDSPAINGSRPAIHYLFRKSTTTPAVTDGLYTLATYNGRSDPIVQYDTITNGVRQYGVILYDSISFSDGAFFRRHRASTWTVNSLSPSSEQIEYGSYRGRPDSLLLTSYAGTAADRVAVEGAQLVRRTRYIYGTDEERYTRR